MDAPHVVLATMDLEAGTSTFVRSDGKEAVVETGFVRGTDSRIAKLQYSPDLDAVLVTTTRGDEVAVPLASSGPTESIGERPVVYLDQNQWSALSKVGRGASKLSPTEEGAARQLIAWAEQRKIVLPMSSGHCTETTEWTDDEGRYALGLTLLRLSSGWQMRHPLDVEHDEIAASLDQTTEQGTTALAVFTQSPAAMANTASRSTYEPDPDLNDDQLSALEAFIHASVTFEMLTDGTPIERQRSDRWREAQTSFGVDLHSESRTAIQKREYVRAFFLSDLSHQFAHTAAERTGSAEDTGPWFEQFIADVPDLRYLGLRYEFLAGKHLNPGTKWYDNDLIDMMFLCLAGGYADLVVCEASAASQIRQAQKRLGRPKTAVAKLADAVEVLAEHGLA